MKLLLFDVEECKSALGYAQVSRGAEIKALSKVAPVYSYASVHHNLVSIAVPLKNGNARNRANPTRQSS